MRFNLSQDEQIFLDSVRRFLRDKLPDSTALATTPESLNREWWLSAAALGWTHLMVPNAFGGFDETGNGFGFLSILAELCGYNLAPGPLISSNVVADTLGRRGTDQQRNEILPRIAAGDLIASWCFVDVHRRSQESDFPLHATRHQDGYLLRGCKVQVEAAVDAEYFLVTSATDDGPAQFLVPANSAGIRAETQEGLDLTRNFGQVTFENVHLPASSMVGTPGDTGSDVERQRQIALLLQCAENCGAASRVFEFTLEWAFERYSFGRPLASYQALKHRFADMKFWLEACFAITDGAQLAIQNEQPSAGRLTGIAKAYVSQYAPALIQECVQMHGGIGVTWEHDLHLYLRRVTTNSVWLGGSADHRAVLARSMTFELIEESKS